MGEQPLVVSELLTFLQQRLDVMDEVSVIQICTTSFTEAEISRARELLYTSLNKRNVMKSYRIDEQGKKSLQDMIKVLKETDPDDVPAFVARELSKLPPVTFDHVDVTRLLKDITTLKSSLAEVLLKFDASQNVILELRKEVNTLRDSVSRSAEASNINTRRGAYVNTSAASSFESAILSPNAGPFTPRELPAPAPAPVPLEHAPAPSTLASPAPAPSKLQAPQPKTKSAPRRNFAAAAARKPEKPQPSADDVQIDDEGFTLVQKKRRKQSCQNKRGTAPTGPNFLLRAAVPTTALYLSRLHHTITAQDVVDYIQTKTKYLVRVDPLGSSHYVHFKTFVARVPTDHLGTFTKEDFWPKGVVFRRFRGSLPNRTPVSTSTSTCVKGNI